MDNPIIYLSEPHGAFYDTLSGYVYDYCCLVDYPCDIHKFLKELNEWKLR